VVDVTLEIMLEPATHDLSYDPEKAARRYRRGDILTGWVASQYATLTDGKYRLNAGAAGSPFAYVHITDVPNSIALKLRDKLTERLEERRRRWRVPQSVLPAAIGAELLTMGEITVDWTAAKTRIRRKIIINPLDASADDESNQLTDSDVL